MYLVYILEMKFVMKNALVQKEVLVKYIVDVIKFYVNMLIMVVIVLKEIVPQIIAHVMLMEENVIHKYVKIVI